MKQMYCVVEDHYGTYMSHPIEKDAAEKLAAELTEKYKQDGYSYSPRACQYRQIIWDNERVVFPSNMEKYDTSTMEEIFPPEKPIDGRKFPFAYLEVWYIDGTKKWFRVHSSID